MKKIVWFNKINAKQNKYACFTFLYNFLFKIIVFYNEDGKNILIILVIFHKQHDSFESSILKEGNFAFFVLLQILIF